MNLTCRKVGYPNPYTFSAARVSAVIFFFFIFERYFGDRVVGKMVGLVGVVIN